MKFLKTAQLIGLLAVALVVQPYKAQAMTQDHPAASVHAEYDLSLYFDCLSDGDSQVGCEINFLTPTITWESLFIGYYDHSQDSENQICYAVMGGDAYACGDDGTYLDCCVVA